MRYLYQLIFLCLLVLVSGCSSPSEIIRIGEPSTQKTDNHPGYIIEGHNNLKEIKNEVDIKEIKRIIETSKKINEPVDVISNPPSVFLELFEPDKSVSLFSYYLWRQSDAGAVIMNSEGVYFEIDEEQTKILMLFFSE